MIGTYTYFYFVLGCALAGSTDEAFTEHGKPAVLPEAESLVAYYLEFPPVRELLDIHFHGVEEYARENLPPELQSVTGDPRSMIENSGAGRADENLPNVVWAIIRESKPFPVEQAIEALSTTFLYGAPMVRSEVARLWGVQAQITFIPMMGEPLEQATVVTIADMAEVEGQN